MKHATLIAIFLVGIVAPLVNAEKANPQSIVKEVLELSGMRKQVEQLPALVQMGTSQNPSIAKLSPQELANVQQAIAESFQPQWLYEAVKAHVQQAYNAERFALLLKWYWSRLGWKISQLEIEASTPQGMQKMQQFAAQLSQKPALPGRLALIRRLEHATDATALHMEMVVSMFQGMAKGLAAALPPEKRLKPGEFEKLTSKMKAQLQRDLPGQVRLMMLFTYQSLSDEDLNAYLTFLESESGRWFNKLAFRGITNAMTQALETFMVQLPKILPATAPKGK